MIASHDVYYGGAHLCNNGALDSNDFASEDKDDKCLLIDAGSCLIIQGGWLERESMYNGVLFGLRYGGISLH